MQDQYHKLMNEAFGLPDGDSKIALLEEAVRIADVHLKVEDRFDARMELTEAAVLSGKVEKAIVAFAWCLHQFDQGVRDHNPYSIIWHYKWICDDVTDFPEISLETIEESLEDYKKRLLANGYGLRSYYKLRCHFAEHLQNTDEVKRYYQLWMDTPRDSMTDCRACELDSQANALLKHIGDFDEAFQVAEPIFKGKLGCSSVPHVTYSPFLLYLLERRQFEQAEEFFQKSSALLPQKRSGHITVAAELIEYLVVVDQSKAISYFEKNVADALASFVPAVKYDFYLAASILFNQLSERERKVVRFPEGVTIESFNQELMEIAERFDQRNGNDYFVQNIKKQQQRIIYCRDLYEQWKEDNTSV